MDIKHVQTSLFCFLFFSFCCSFSTYNIFQSILCIVLSFINLLLKLYINYSILKYWQSQAIWSMPLFFFFGFSLFFIYIYNFYIYIFICMHLYIIIMVLYALYILYVVWFTIFTLVTSQLISWRKKISQLELNSLLFTSFSSFSSLFIILFHSQLILKASLYKHKRNRQICKHFVN